MAALAKKLWVTNKPGVRPDIQALRAFAVVCVIINHFAAAKLPGGFIGVDIFFVISGFLITTHLLREHSKRGKINFAKFYARRARRLLPAALTVTIVSMLCVWLFFPLDRIKQNISEAFASSAYFQNWVLYVNQTDYFNAAQPATVFQHYWSLSVEEQFYLCWPLLLALLLLAALKIKTAGSRAWFVFLTIALLTIASFGYALQQFTADPLGVYFNTFARAWEFLCGSLAAYGVSLFAASASKPLLLQKPLVNAGVQLTCWALLLISVFKLDAQAQVPGAAALMPVLATAVLLSVGAFANSNMQTAIWGFWPLQFVGNISYSLYLWHWPLLLIAPFAFGVALGPKTKILLILLLLPVACASYYLIENPARKKLFVKRPSWVTLTAVAASIALLAVSVPLLQSNVDTQLAKRTAQAAVQLEKQPATCVGAGAVFHADCSEYINADPLLAGVATQEPWSNHDKQCRAVSGKDVGLENILECDYSGGQKTTNLVLFGDSHAEHFAHAASSLAKANKWRLRVYAVGGCYPLPLDKTHAKTAVYNSECQAFAKQAHAHVLASKPDLLLYTAAVNSQAAYVTEIGEQAHNKALQAAFSQWQHAQIPVVVLKDVPYAGEILGPGCLEKNQPQDCQQSLAASGTDLLYAAAQQWQQDDPKGSIKTLQLNDLLCPEDACRAVIGGLPVYYDNDHLTRGFSVSLAPELAKRLNKLWQTPIVAPKIPKKVVL